LPAAQEGADIAVDSDVPELPRRCAPDTHRDVAKSANDTLGIIAEDFGVDGLA